MHDAPEANLNKMAEMCDSLDPYDEYLSRFEPSGAHENQSDVLPCRNV